MENLQVNTSGLMSLLKQEGNVTFYTTWKTHDDFLPMLADKQNLLENLEHQLKVNGEQTFGLMMKETTTEFFNVQWVEKVEFFLL